MENPGISYSVALTWSALGFDVMVNHPCSGHDRQSSASSEEGMQTMLPYCKDASQKVHTTFTYIPKSHHHRRQGNGVNVIYSRWLCSQLKLGFCFQEGENN